MSNVTPAFKMQKRLQPLWCWSAVATSTASFYDSSSSHSQCSVANAILRLTVCCCANGSDPQCDVPHSLERALQYVGHWRQTIRGAVSWTDLDDEIRNNRPVGVLISLLGGSGHCVAVVGTGTRRNDEITIEDPLHERITTTLRLFAKTAHGSWSETYFTSA